MRPTCTFLAATEYAQPFELPLTAVGTDAGLIEALSAVAPHKTGFWQANRSTSLVVAPHTAEPFGLSLAQIEERILKTSLPKAAEAVARRFGVEVVLDAKASESDACPVDLESFCGLYSIAVDGNFADAVLVTCFIAPETVYASRVARGTPLKDALQSFPAIASRFNAGEISAHLLSGIPLPPDTPCSHLTSLIHFPQDGTILGANDSWLLPFPTFNRRLSMCEGSRSNSSPAPCSNCMACSRFCPAGIRPSFLHHHLLADDEDTAADLGLGLCIQCGWCSFVCPSNLPLAQTIIENRKGGDV